MSRADLTDAEMADLSRIGREIHAASDVAGFAVAGGDVDLGTRALEKAASLLDPYMALLDRLLA
jgi:hypothetical protein